MKDLEHRLQEIWKIIPNTQNRYAVSNFGKIKSVERIVEYADGRKYHYKEHILKLRKDSDGYLLFSIRNLGKHETYKAHRVVADAFIDNPQNKKEVNHINGKKDDNFVENLEWVTSSENKIHAFKNRLTNPIKNLKNAIIPKGIENKHSKTLIVYKNDEEIKKYTPVKSAKNDGYNLSKIYNSIKFSKFYKGLSFKIVENEKRRA